MLRLLGVALALTALGCADIDDPITDAVLPKDYKSTYVEVRSCRPSVPHDGASVIVRVPPAVKDAYDRGPFPLPVGTVIALEQYGDELCQSLHSWTVMKKEKAGYDSDGGDWHWQRIEAIDGRVSLDGKLSRCSSCHAACKARDFTCSAL